MNKPLDLRIFQHIRQLGLADGQYVVVGSGLLVALGLADWDDDLDITVRQEVFDAFKNEGWQQEDYNGTAVLKNDMYDIGTSFGEWSLEELLADALIIRSIPFISPAKLLAWKQNANRPQDEKHITILQSYLKKNP